LSNSSSNRSTTPGLTILVRAALFAMALLIALVALDRPRRAILVTTNSVSHTLCSEVFLANRDPAQIYAEVLRPEVGMGLLDWALRYTVDGERREVRATVAHYFSSRAVYRERLGCLIAHGSQPADDSVPSEKDDVLRSSVALLPEIAGREVVEPTDTRLRAAIDRAFAEPDRPPYRWTKAVVVVHDGRVVGERYAPGYQTDTPFYGHSMTKSVINALVGILVRQGSLSVSESGVVPAWRGSSDQRRQITIDQLLRMASGLPSDEYAPGWDPATRMWFLERDMAAFAEDGQLDAPPGTRWNYSNRGYMVLSRLIRDAVGGHAADVVRFAHRDLFDLLGMRNATWEFDGTGTPVGTSQLFASARDWARFGMLYLLDGVVGDRRILPEGWVTYSKSQTLEAGYGAGFWLNTVTTPMSRGGYWGMPGAPPDAFFARGYLGQFVVVVPSKRLVVVRLGVSHSHDGGIESVGRLVGDVGAVLRSEQ